MKKRVAILGATGSIGKSALDVIAQSKDQFEVVLLSAHHDREGLEKAGRDWPGAAQILSSGEGRRGLLAAIAESGAEITLNGIAGAAGLEPSVAAITAGSSLALANKETLVMAGPLVFSMAAEKSVQIIPVDSEHSAIFHLLAAHTAGRESALDEIILTASGGPFRNYSLKEMESVNPAAALAHPTWSMGPKITIDSSTMANKGLEVIEAARLFNMPPEKIKVVIHPQSIVHSMVRLRDGAIYAQLSKPDMRLPIHEALHWPETAPSRFGHLDFDSLRLDFEKPDLQRFPMLDFAYRAVAAGGQYPCAYNGANEVAVAAFLAGRINFLDIARITGYVLDSGWEGEDVSLESVLDTDRRARVLAEQFIKEKE